ncbi:hypothetical protein FNF27_07223 [Cafeteria roenbergensis]|uniref:Amine oxidase domain-containing protein n=4 Tax=Cafeteria roenbergensis TaxID=33653 RepID=A0A5A8DRB0_CAFRO|nr:hypothetical protein FNF29_01893 [Cafeteria roenbergensis]KAA0167976.1 hypothetical protein FNF27_07223 [Cafeteria roenbergensis]|eukprot:KAA0155142.1 hypothetical protein FNF29_01893 [Cafeteria roenbergensis]
MEKTRVCVVGSGVSGLGAAWLLSQRHDVEVTMFEERHQAGGHANTVEIDGFPVDTGFLVFNELTYPNMIRLFEHVGVKSDPSDMSFSVSMHEKTMEWSSDPAGVLGTPGNVVSPRFWQMIRDMMRFNAEAPKLLEESGDDEITLGEYLDANGYSQAFCDYYLFPMVACVWSATAEDVMLFPARTLIRFFVNHHLVSLEKPQWRTVSGRSREYVRKLTQPFRSRLHLNAPVASIVRRAKAGADASATEPSPLKDSGFESVVTLKSGETHVFDHVVMACHPDQALRILGADASAAEREVLGAFHYDPNIAYLHRDASFMPKRKACWTSWNFLGHGKLDESSLESARAGASEACCVTYWLNRLQNFSAADRGDVFVTLNPPHPPRPDSVIQTMEYAHPQFTVEAIKAQGRVAAELQGRRGTWFAGAYLGYGFHEDGLTSGLRAAFRLGGVAPPWWRVPDGTPLAAAPHRPSAFELDAMDADARVAAVARACAVGVKASLDGAAAARGLSGSEASAGYILASSASPDLVAELAVFGLHTSPDAASAAASTVGMPEADDDSGSGSGSDAMTSTPSEGGGASVDSDDSAGRPAGLRRRRGDDSVSAAGAGPFSGDASDAAADVAARQGRGSGRSSVASLRLGARRRCASLGPAPAARLVPCGPGGEPVVWEDPWRPGAVSTPEQRRAKGVTVAAVGAGGGGSSFGGFVDAAPESVPGTVRFYRARAWPAVEGAAAAAAASGAAAGEGGGYTVLGAEAGGKAAAPLGGTRAAAAGREPAGWCDSLLSPTAWASAAWGLAAQASSWPVLSVLRAGIVEGCVVLREPSGHSHLFGDALAPAHLRSEVHVSDAAFFFRVAAEADVGLARAYIAGQWSCDDLAALFRVFIANRDSSKSSFSSGKVWTATLGRLLNLASYSLFLDNSLAGSRANIHAHYDLSNALFETFLDPTTMAYSCARFRVDGVDERTGRPRFAGSLDDAQVRKLDDLIELADVRAEHEVLDIGCGWGGLAIRLAQTRGCKVHGITLSSEQKAWAEKRVEALGLSDRITFQLVDYRDLAAARPAAFDRIITVEMIEAVGYNYLGTFMAACGRLLKPSGTMVMQAITMPEPRYEEYKSSADFINTIIFPGGHCPCVTSLTDAMSRNSDMTLEHVRNYALHYAETLRVWRRNFNARLDRVRALGFDAAFVRMWNYYLAYCEAGFDTQTLGLHALVFAKPAAKSAV